MGSMMITNLFQAFTQKFDRKVAFEKLTICLYGNKLLFSNVKKNWHWM